ncbi:MAG: leucyl aminopeptidase [Yoonia sp.]|nr:leucyl aminopeptidase [Yoonia sp.]
MTELVKMTYSEVDLEAVATLNGLIAIFVGADGKLDTCARKVNTLSRKAVKRLVASDAFAGLSDGGALRLAFPAGLAAAGILVVKLSRRPTQEAARLAGAALAQEKGPLDLTVLAGNLGKLADVALGLALRDYDFSAHKTAAPKPRGAVKFMSSKLEDIDSKLISAIAGGVFFTRDLTNEPANILTTSNFADRLAEMQALGLKVEVLEEAALEKMGMGALLCVGQGSVSPSKVVVMQWHGGGDEAPFALVGKGVVFDTGGISIKPALGMEDMTMDMGGAGVVSGVMRTLAQRKAKANVVGVLGLVENMPSGNAVRPGDVVTSMKGDKIEVVNTDAEGRLVLADVLWYTQERFKPVGMINLATLTGAIIVALGHENAGVFSNSDDLSAAFLKAAGAEGEGAWRMPLSAAYDKMIDCRIADMRNTGGTRDAGSITAAQFLARFVKPETPWAHLDIAGVASIKGGTKFAPAGATGWGVMTLNRFISDNYEA